MQCRRRVGDPSGISSSTRRSVGWKFQRCGSTVGSTAASGELAARLPTGAPRSGRRWQTLPQTEVLRDFREQAKKLQAEAPQVCCEAFTQVANRGTPEWRQVGDLPQTEILRDLREQVEKLQAEAPLVSRAASAQGANEAHREQRRVEEPSADGALCSASCRRHRRPKPLMVPSQAPRSLSRPHGSREARRNRPQTLVLRDLREQTVERRVEEPRGAQASAGSARTPRPLGVAEDGKILRRPWQPGAEEWPPGSRSAPLARSTDPTGESLGFEVCRFNLMSSSSGCMHRDGVGVNLAGLPAGRAPGRVAVNPGR
mgnify:CR=1 FL=1